MTAHLTNAWRGGHSGDRRPGWKIQFRYDEDAIAALKAAVPASEREWNPDGEYWWVAERHTDTLLGLFPSFYVYLNQPAMF